MATVRDTSTWATLGHTGRNAYRVSDTCVDMRRERREIRTVGLGARPQDLILDVGRTALVVIDMQNDFCSPEGWIASLGVDVTAARALVDPINRVTAAARSTGIPVIWVNWASDGSLKPLALDPASLQPKWSWSRPSRSGRGEPEVPPPAPKRRLGRGNHQRACAGSAGHLHREASHQRILEHPTGRDLA